MTDIDIQEVLAGLVRREMRIIPLGATEPKPKSRFAEGLLQAFRGEGVASSTGSKRRRIEGELVGKASAVIADPGASDTELRSAFLRVSNALEGEMLRGIAMEQRLRGLEAEISRLKTGQETKA